MTTPATGTAVSDPREDARPRALAIAGPTASGKTAFALECARRYDGEIVSVDSALVYRGLDIGSARIATEIEQAYDTFYVTDHQGRRLEDAAQMDRLRDALEDALLKPL